MGKHAANKRVSDSDTRRRVFKWLKITGLAAIIILLAGTVAALAFLASVSSRIHQGVDKKVQRQIAKSKPLAPQNILILGSDTRGEKHARSDTIIIAHIDTRHKKVQLLSIPRDLRVDIPDVGKDKINAAMFYGGPALTIRTVRQLTGLPIHHFVEVDFKGFRQLVDATGGVWINVEKRIDDPKAGSAVIEPGYRRLWGKAALTYVRTRKDKTGDYARMERQRKFFGALLDQSRRFQTVFRIPQLINIFAENTETDMTLAEMSSLAYQMKSISKKDMEGATIPTDDEMINGVWYAMLRADELAKLTYRIKTNQSLKGPGRAIQAAAKPIRPGDVSVEIKNGGGPLGSAAQLGRKLNAAGFIVTKVGNAKRDDYQTTQVVYRDSRAKAAKVRSSIGQGQLAAADGQYQTNADVLVIVGADYY